MNHETQEQKDQAEQLRALLSEVEENNQNESLLTEDDYKEESYPTREVDILNLPPRSEIHTQKNGRVNLKLSRPFMRMVFVSLILLFVLIFAVYNWGIL
ncbi:hypothetical protein [Ornithinibacillus halophilus]|uniref:Uncharacterized protein n=1 Tax=Ornithinibacillus halophilus TaxID=930117 RepID=A0A1M5CS63_9BACI|nr:hypothetical protein [Ornithinibacillus halophilus]SHF57544.1 hypothetical protein SAMN05216225_1001365 [Ornithinibacillus halophilus]